MTKLCKNCPHENKKRYTGSEPSPKGLGYCGGCAVIGEEMEGADGNLWIAKERSNGSVYWARKKTEKAEKVKVVKKKAPAAAPTAAGQREVCKSFLRKLKNYVDTVFNEDGYEIHFPNNIFHLLYAHYDPDAPLGSMDREISLLNPMVHLRHEEWETRASDLDTLNKVSPETIFQMDMFPNEWEEHQPKVFDYDYIKTNYGNNWKIYLQLYDDFYTENVMKNYDKMYAEALKKIPFYTDMSAVREEIVRGTNAWTDIIEEGKDEMWKSKLPKVKLTNDEIDFVVDIHRRVLSGDLSILTLMNCDDLTKKVVKVKRTPVKKKAVSPQTFLFGEEEGERVMEDVAASPVKIILDESMKMGDIKNKFNAKQIFYKLGNKSESIASTKMVILEQPVGTYYFGDRARELAGLSKTQNIKIKAIDIPNGTLYVESKSWNRKINKGDIVLIIRVAAPEVKVQKVSKTHAVWIYWKNLGWYEAKQNEEGKWIYTNRWIKEGTKTIKTNSSDAGRTHKGKLNEVKFKEYAKENGDYIRSAGLRPQLLRVRGGEMIGGGNNNEKSVIVLTDSNFHDHTKKGKWLIDFYAPWCDWCKELEPTWNVLAKDNDTEVKIAKLDATQNKNIAREFEIQGYPTIKYIQDGQEIEQYKDDRSLDNLKKYISSK